MEFEDVTLGDYLQGATCETRILRDLSGYYQRHDLCHEGGGYTYSFLAYAIFIGRRPRLLIKLEDRECNIYICESKAYRHLTQAGICARGITPSSMEQYKTLTQIYINLILEHWLKMNILQQQYSWSIFPI